MQWHGSWRGDKEGMHSYKWINLCSIYDWMIFLKALWKVAKGGSQSPIGHSQKFLYTVRTEMGNFNAGGNRAGVGHNFSSVLLEGHIGP